MVKKTIKETVTEYDEAGKITRQTITETTEEDDTDHVPYTPSYPSDPFWYQSGPTCSGDSPKPQAYID